MGSIDNLKTKDNTPEVSVIRAKATKPETGEPRPSDRLVGTVVISVVLLGLWKLLKRL